MILNSLEYNHMPDVSNCINLINQLITETDQQYLDLKGSKTSVDPSIPSLLNLKHRLHSEVGSINDNSESLVYLVYNHVSLDIADVRIKVAFLPKVQNRHSRTNCQNDFHLTSTRFNRQMQKLPLNYATLHLQLPIKMRKDINSLLKIKLNMKTSKQIL